jgi:integrase
MARDIDGSVFPAPGGGYGIRWPENGRRPQQTGFRTKTEAREWFRDHVKPRLRRRGPSPQITFDAFCDDYLDRWGADVAQRTRDDVAEWLGPARKRFGDWTLAELEGAADDVARWRAKLPTDDRRHKCTRGLRQALAAAVRWGYIERNPAKDMGANRAPRVPEIHPFTREELDAIVAEVADSPRDAGAVIFAAETGLRTSEWPALDRADIDWRNPAVAVQRRFTRGQITPYPKTAKSRRRVPLTPRAVDALGARRIDTTVLFANRFGERLNYDNWRCRIWTPALKSAGVPLRGPYHLRHTFATEALAAGVSIFELSRLMGASVAMIDKTYGHLARDSEASLRARLAARSDGSGVLVASPEEGDS